MKSSHTGSLTHGNVVHVLNPRVRNISSVLLKDPERACVLEILLQARDGIEKVRTVPDIASAGIHSDSKLPKNKAVHPFGCVTGESEQTQPDDRISGHGFKLHFSSPEFTGSSVNRAKGFQD